MKILVTFAVDAEFGPWRKRYEFRSVRRSFAGQDSSTKLYRAESEGIQLDVLLTGIGWSAASAASMADEIAFIDAEESQQIDDGWNRRFAHADRTDLGGFDDGDGGAGARQHARQHAGGHPSGGAAPDDRDAGDSLVVLLDVGHK